MTSVRYGTYIRSPEWRARARMMLHWFNHRCQLCNTTERLHVHHRTYERLGDEHPTDLIVLCEHCHKRHHGLLPSMEPASDEPEWLPGHGDEEIAA